MAKKKSELVFPKKFNILGCNWKITLKEKHNALGTCEATNREITLKVPKFKNKRQTERFRDSFFHEITHMLLATSTSHSLYSDEKVVVPLSKAIRDFTLQMIKLNKI